MDNRSRFATRQGHLAFAVPGFLVLALALLLFESSANLTTYGFVQIVDDLLAPPERHQAMTPAAVRADDARQTAVRQPIVMLAEAKGRYIWLSTVMLNLVITCYVGASCGRLILRQSGARLWMLGGLAAGLSIAGLFFLATLAEDDVLYRTVYGFTYQSLARSGQIHDHLLGFARTAVSAINVLAVLAPIIAVTAACAVVAPPEQQGSNNPPALVARMRQLNEVLYGGSAILVTGILHMGAWLRWPASLIADRGSRDAVLGVALAITIFWGTAFTLMLLVTYVPAAVYLAKQAHGLFASDDYARTVPDPDGWLRQHGFHLSLEQHLLQFGALLAPVLAGPLGSFLLAPLELIDQ
jgi:hypothetical protein